MSEPESYTLAEFGVTRDSDGASIPADLENRDWRAFQEWLTAGNTPNPMPAPVVDPNAAATAEALASARGKIANAASLTAAEESAVFPTTA